MARVAARSKYASVFSVLLKGGDPLRKQRLGLPWPVKYALI